MEVGSVDGKMTHLLVNAKSKMRGDEQESLGEWAMNVAVSNDNTYDHPCYNFRACWNHQIILGG